MQLHPSFKKIFAQVLASLILLILLKLCSVHNSIRFLTNDFYIQAFQISKNIQEINNEIAIVNIKDFPLEAIRDQIEILTLYEPKVIGIDYFPDKNEGENPEPIGFKNIIQPTLIDDNSIEYSISYFSDSCYYGYANVLSTSRFEPFLKVNGHQYPSFPTKIIELFDSSLYRLLLNRKQSSEIINYQGNAYQFLYLNDLSTFNPDLLEKIKDKIVLVGYTGLTAPIPEDLKDQDTHLTPIGEMYGVVLLANILNTLMNHYITPVDNLWLCLIAIILTVGVVLISNYIYTKTKFGYLYIKLFQILTVFTCFIGASISIHKLEISIDYELLCFAVLIAGELSYWSNKILLKI